MLNWYSSGFQGALIARQGYYSAQPENARKFLTAAEWDYWYDGKPAATEMLPDPFGKPAIRRPATCATAAASGMRMGNIAVWNSVMDEDRYLTRKWNEFITPDRFISDVAELVMQLGVFIPIGNNGWLISTTSPQYKPSFDLNRTIVEKAERFGFDFALSMIKLRGFGGPCGFWDYNLEIFTLMAGLAAVTKRIQLFATCAVLTIPPRGRSADGGDRRQHLAWPVRGEPHLPAGSAPSIPRWDSGLAPRTTSDAMNTAPNTCRS